MLVQRFDIFPAFVDVVSGFGRKTSEIDEQSPRCFLNLKYSNEYARTIDNCGKAYMVPAVTESNQAKRLLITCIMWRNTEDKGSKIHGQFDRRQYTSNGLVHNDRPPGYLFS